MKQLNYFLLSLALLVTISLPNAKADFNGKIEFTDAEKFQAYQESENLADASANCLHETFKYHEKFFGKYKISPYYGNNGSWQRMSMIDRMEFFQKKKIPMKVMDLLQPISCVGFVTQCTEQGFLRTGQDTAWSKIKKFMEENDHDGLSLQHALHQLGWSVLFWNPDNQKSFEFDQQEQSSDPENKKRYWGYHEYRWKTITSTGLYMSNQVDDYSLLVDFKEKTPKALKKATFFVGTAHGGYHVFSGSEGKITEAHSMRDIDDKSNIEEAEFNPLKRHGAPTGRYRSGLIAVPPGYLQEMQKRR